MANSTWFDPELIDTEWFDVEFDSLGWFDTDLIQDAVASATEDPMPILGGGYYA